MAKNGTEKVCMHLVVNLSLLECIILSVLIITVSSNK